MCPDQLWISRTNFGVILGPAGPLLVAKTGPAGPIFSSDQIFRDTPLLVTSVHVKPAAGPTASAGRGLRAVLSHLRLGKHIYGTLSATKLMCAKRFRDTCEQIPGAVWKRNGSWLCTVFFLQTLP